MKKCPFCAEMIQEEARFCRYCHQQWSDDPEPIQPQGHIHPAIIVLGALILLGACWFALGGFDLMFGTTREGRYVAPSSPVTQPPVATKFEYDQLQDGMTYEQVVQIIGAPGTELSRSSIAGYTTVLYQWMNPNGSNMTVQLQNGRLIAKAQFGLP